MNDDSAMTTQQGAKPPEQCAKIAQKSVMPEEPNPAIEVTQAEWQAASDFAEWHGGFTASGLKQLARAFAMYATARRALDGQAE